MEYFCPDSRPRKPRNRASYRNVTSPGSRSQPREIKPYKFPADEPDERKKLKELKAILGSGQTSTVDLWQRLEFVAGQNLHWHRQPQPSKSEARYQIKLLAFQAGRILSQKGNMDKARREFSETLDDLNDLARTALWCAISEHPDWKIISEGAGADENFTPEEYLQGNDVDVELIGQCVAAIYRRLETRGDYADFDLALSVAELVPLFEDWTGEKATWSVWRDESRHDLSSHGQHSCDPDTSGSYEDRKYSSVSRGRCRRRTATGGAHGNLILRGRSTVWFGRPLSVAEKRHATGDNSGGADRRPKMLRADRCHPRLRIGWQINS